MFRCAMLLFLSLGLAPMSWGALALEGGFPLAEGPRKENSGIVGSRTTPGLYWMINDSGDEPRVYPVGERGEAFEASRYGDTPGVLLGGAINVDWEDIAVDGAGRLLIPDFGNNRNDRRDLVIYVVPEPSPLAGRTTYLERLFFSYPEQKAFPAPKDDFNYDSEALFAVGRDIFVLTKHRSDTATRLYRLPEGPSDTVIPLVLEGQFPIGGKVTGADASLDGLRLIVTTYDRLWLFERASLAEPFFQGRISVLDFEADQVEAVCFSRKDSNRLLVADEARGELYHVSLNAFKPYRSEP